MEQADLIQKLKNGDEFAFEELFRLFYAPLCQYAHGILQEKDAAEEIVQDVFVAIWEKRHSLEFHTGIRPYLYKAVHNRCLNQIQHHKIRNLHQQEVLYTQSEIQPAAAGAEYNQLQHHLQKAMLKLPEECRKVFKLSRENEFSYREIADFLNISIKTVENQIGKALRILRTELKDFLPLWWAILLIGYTFFSFHIGVIAMLTVIR